MIVPEMSIALFLALLLLLSVPSSLSQCHSSQRNALLKLKQRFRSPLSVIADSWLPGTDCCRGWTGVTCDSASGDIVALDLSGLSISGDLDPALFDLVSLQSLDLSCNNLSSDSLLPSFSTFEKLTHLNLSDSGLSGGIPEGISSLRSLVSLDLSTPGLCSQSSFTFQENFGLLGLIRNLSNLHQLYLDGVNVSAGGRLWSDVISSSVPNLRELSMYRCSLSGPIEGTFSKLKFLQVLRLNENDLNTEVPDFFGDFSSLRVLRLSSCGLRGYLPERIFLLPFLQTLDLSMNPSLNGKFPDFLPTMPLQDLMLQSTNFSGNLPDSIGNLKLLNTLLLSGCRLSGLLPSSLQDLTQLVIADLSQNNFSGPIPYLASLSNISKLDFRNNSLSGTLPSWIFRLPSLRIVQLSSNRLSGSLEEMSVQEESSLETVDLSSNFLEGLIPESIARLQNLKILCLDNNKLNGTVDLALFGNLKNLSALDLSFNKLIVRSSFEASINFQGISTLSLACCGVKDFPPFLRTLSRLTSLDLSGNEIGGSIPDWLWRSKSLAYLNLSYNSFTDIDISANFTGSSTLKVLDLRSNQLQGAIPLPPPSNLVVDFSKNNFSSIPANIGSTLNFTVFFSVSGNSLAGEIPKSLCESAYIQVLDLSHNILSGNIPNCLFGVEKLQVLNLRGNKLAGLQQSIIPPETCRIRSLNLNGNMIKGRVPQTLRNCGDLEVLDLGNNEIEDEFPFWLGDLSNLRVLVLRSNKFFGPLPRPQGKNNSFSSLRIMDISSNRFNGSLPQECFESLKAMSEDDVISGEQMVVKFGFLPGKYYVDSVTVTSKGLELTLVKILTIFTSLDLSDNEFTGEIPPATMELRAMHVLNMSRNRLSGPIPWDVGKLKMLESLDLSVNELSGVIPPGLASLSFLSFLNLSYNRLVGRIPTGRQLQTLGENSFLGNQGLCGEPLPIPCPIESQTMDAASGYNWLFISIGAGYGGGMALVFGVLFLWGKGRRWYKEQVDSKLLTFFPPAIPHLCGICLDSKGDSKKRFEGDDREEEIEGRDIRFCVFCSQLEFTGEKLVIRHVPCPCTPGKEM